MISRPRGLPSVSIQRTEKRGNQAALSGRFRATRRAGEPIAPWFLPSYRAELPDRVAARANARLFNHVSGSALRALAPREECTNPVRNPVSEVLNG